MIVNLNEAFLYRKLPEGVIDLDERGLMAALMGGIQDRLDDLRSYSRKLQFLLDPTNLPDTGDNVVLVDVTSDQGVVFTRSLDFMPDTPAADSSDLLAWCGRQLDLETSSLSNARYGRDLLRTVDVNTLGYLAETIGAVLYQTAITDPDAARDIILTYFPRLRIKGTSRSFEVLARLLGFSDLVYAPLWGRLSPRDPADPGNPVNDPDFSYYPEFYPKQTIGPLYDPLAQRDGVFYSWSGTVSNGTAATNYYTSVINGNNPWLEVVVLGAVNGTSSLPAIQSGTASHISAGTYALAGGAPNTRAFVDPDGSSFRVRALADGAAWNGLHFSVAEAYGTLRVLTVDDRLSTIKYRTAYYSIYPTVDIELAGSYFGERPIRPNPDLRADTTLTSDGTAASPYRPWQAGQISAGSVVTDWLTTSGSVATSTLVARTQASGTNRELVYTAVIEAGKQVGAAMEEVRAATRIQRGVYGGLLLDETLPYARYLSSGSLFTTQAGVLTYSGSHPLTPLPPYTAAIELHGPNGTVTTLSELAGTLPATGLYITSTASFSGTYGLTTGVYQFTFAASPANGTQVWARWTATSTEVIRDEPSTTAKNEGSTATQRRPEDAETDTVINVTDDYPWLRSLVVGGELIESDAHPAEPPAVVVEEVADVTDVPDQSGAPNTVYTVVSRTVSRARFVSTPKPTDDTYQPGRRAVGFRGTRRSLAAYSASQMQLLSNSTDFDTQFQSGYSIFNVGYVTGVLVADPARFNAPHHRDGIVGWIPFNEHPDEQLLPADRVRPLASVDSAGLNGITDRVWDENKGWYHQFKPGDFLVYDRYRNVEDDFTISFWFKAGAFATGVTEFLKFGPVSFDINNAIGEVNGYVVTADGLRTNIGWIADTGWVFVYLRRTATQAFFGYDGAGGSGVFQVDLDFTGFTEDDTQLVIRSGMTFGIHDLRLWNTCKSVADLALVQDYAPQATAVNYRLSSIPTVDRGDVYGFEVLSNGFVTPGRLPAWNRSTAESRLYRYVSTGSYVGPVAYAEVGLGANYPFPGHFNPGTPDYQLGYVFPFPESTGTVPTAGTTSVFPGMNTVWSNDTGGTVIVRLSGGSISTGSVAVLVPVTSSDWPPVQMQLNTAVQSIWVQGDDSSVYRITLAGVGGSVQLAAYRESHARGDENIRANPVFAALLDTGTYASGGLSATLMGGTLATISYGTATSVINLGSLAYDYQLTDAHTTMTRGGKALRIAVTGSTTGVPYVGTTASSLTTPDVWMYLYERVTLDASNAWSTWIGGGVGYDGGLFGNKTELHPDVPEQVPALATNGQLDFENSTALAVGWYRLTLDVGNIGRTDPAFDGLAVEYSLNGSDWTSLNLLAGQSGYNIRGSVPVDFELTEATPAPWLLSIRWINAFSDFEHKVQRQLVVYGYRIERLAPEMWRVGVYGTPGSVVYTNVSPTPSAYSSSTAGGWLFQYDNNGIIAPLSHEMLTYLPTPQ